MLVQSVGCEDADTSKNADKSASLFVLNLLSSEVLCFESTPAEQIQLPLAGSSAPQGFRKRVLQHPLPTFVSHGRFTSVSRSVRPAGRQLPFPVRHVDRYLTHYKPAFAFSRLPCPQHDQLSLRSALPAILLLATLRGCRVPYLSMYVQVRCHLFPGSRCVSVIPSNKRSTNCGRRISILRRLTITRFISDSHMFTMLDWSSPSSTV